MRYAIRSAIANVLRDLAVRLYDLAEDISPAPWELPQPIDLGIDVEPRQ